MVKRGIGAAVLAIITALFLGYLLKGKGQERQAVVDMTLPGAQEIQKSLNIPALKGSNSNTSNLVQKTNNSPAESVVASADGAADKVNQATKDIRTKETAVNTFKNKGDDLDFTIRPPKGEKREFVDNIGKTPQQQRAPRTAISSTTTSYGSNEGAIVASANSNSTNDNRQSSSGSITRSSSKGTVVASSDAQKESYRPRLENERRRSANYGLATEESVKRARQRKEREERRAERRKAREKVAKENQSGKTSDNKQQPTKNPSNKKEHYAIQLLATSSSSRAINLKNVMRKEGYSTFISKTSRNGKVLFRVRIGNYISQQAAESAQKSMQRRYRKNQQVKNSIIVSR